MDSWKNNVRKVVPYTPGEQPKLDDIIKLNTNENPYPPSAGVADVINNFKTDALRKYPDPSCTELVCALSNTYGVARDRIFVGVGSDDVLATAFMTYFCSDKPVLFPDVTYSFYEVWADMLKIPYKKMPLNDALEINPDDYIGRQNGGIIFPNPNAPTGLEMPLESVEKIIKANPDSVVIIDEAYVDFGAHSALPLIDKYDNLLVVQTFSKSRSLAGLRVGYAFGSKELVSYLWDVRNSYNSYTLNMMSIKAGAAALADDKYFRDTLDKIIATREKAKKNFKKLGFEVGDSKANFLFVKHKSIPAERIFKSLYENRIFVRYFSAPRTRDYLRVTIGTDKEMEALFLFLKETICNMEN